MYKTKLQINEHHYQVFSLGRVLKDGEKMRSNIMNPVNINNIEFVPARDDERESPSRIGIVFSSRRL